MVGHVTMWNEETEIIGEYDMGDPPIETQWYELGEQRRKLRKGTYVKMVNEENIRGMRQSCF